MRPSEDLLLEIGCEELPAQEQPRLLQAAPEIFQGLLDEAGIAFGVVHGFVGPRRLALLVEDLALETQAREEWRRGPSLDRAFTADGQPSAAALGFARSCGVAPDALEELATDKGPVLAFRVVTPAQSSARLLPGIAQRWLQTLPLRKRMRWGERDDRFSRPVRWLVLRLGSQVLPWQSFGLEAGAASRGHRVHHPEAVPLPVLRDYPTLLREAKVRADWHERRQHILRELSCLAEKLGAQALLDDALADEITGLNEWPVALAGSFDPDYLRVPEAVLRTVMVQHQRYVPLRGGDGRLAPHYLFIANIASRDPQVVVRGNDRVLRARLADAAFFWDQDRRRSLASRLPELDALLFQDGLGSMAEKSHRLEALARSLAVAFGLDPRAAAHAARLCKADLLTGMVGEFPELQGIMGGHYARHDGEDEAIATAIAEQYRPAGRDDPLPESPLGRILALADKADTLWGFFAIGQIPSGDRDPFGLRRAALGILRIALEGSGLSLRQLLRAAADGYGASLHLADPEAVTESAWAFVQERLRVLLRDEGFAADQIQAVLAVAGDDPIAARRRLESLAEFLRLHESADALAALIKRINNLLRKEDLGSLPQCNPDRLQEPAEIALWREYSALQEALIPLLAAGDFAASLDLLAGLRSAVDRFFQEILVLCEDARLRANRLALLAQIQKSFLQIADFSLLQGRS
ncbi:glycine--tRNA ligase subunit beta [Acidithiobacillus caldus]|jgi:glycyl-tRNA synthetase beta chain|uniref:Glycine--tRNA ligase beta subunit n=5 Tax=Acidithiobacillus caldus TaxID=33059 RepID=F9ZRJ9_ACICS|nr:glycine--tRNA ligase subunit beta [Acidithiobacillus caldus]AEK59037.1 Glycyl-tRNA synthetase beta chain [Acidithiobacillus caldus SM-1]AIA56086.1 Glycyl-tRNA synthetase beta chain [Acidithiobacillus caldus ATCC 51756]AUW33435.1 glycine--tRNA ligase subunit beta [Acidithiobacillus caldus]MBU2730629.1 glycine--tRNA ligase subunit beta [Acidithiobacillus caldus]MBU2736221.1 glycine--tRNA ligase subunit beta [Acidithiobacillus caldus ATCC 51756]